MISRLSAGPDNRDCAYILARQVFRSDRAGCRGPKISNESVVEENRGRCARLGVEHDDHAVICGETQLWIVQKSRDDFDPIVRPTAHVSGLDVNLAMVFRHVKLDYGWQLCLPSGVRSERPLHCLDAGMRIQ